MKAAYKKLYETPVTEIVSIELSPILYQTSIPQGDEGEEGGDPDARQHIFSEGEGDGWANGFSLWKN